MSHPLISPEPTYNSHEGMGLGMNQEASHFQDTVSMVGTMTPKQVALYLVFAGGTLFFLQRAGFRFNFGVSAGR